MRWMRKRWSSMVSGVRNVRIGTENSLKMAFFAVFDQNFLKFHSEKSSNLNYLGNIDFKLAHCRH